MLPTGLVHIQIDSFAGYREFVNEGHRVPTNKKKLNRMKTKFTFPTIGIFLYTKHTHTFIHLVAHNWPYDISLILCNQNQVNVYLFIWSQLEFHFNSLLIHKPQVTVFSHNVKNNFCAVIEFLFLQYLKAHEIYERILKVYIA